MVVLRTSRSAVFLELLRLRFELPLGQLSVKVIRLAQNDCARAKATFRPTEYVGNRLWKTWVMASPKPCLLVPTTGAVVAGKKIGVGTPLESRTTTGDPAVLIYGSSRAGHRCSINGRVSSKASAGVGGGEGRERGRSSFLVARESICAFLRFKYCSCRSGRFSKASLIASSKVAV